MTVKTDDLKSLVKLFKEQYKTREKAFQKYADSQYSTMIEDIVKLLDYISIDYDGDFEYDNYDYYEEFSILDKVAYSGIILLDLLTEATKRSKKNRRKKYIESAIKNYYQIVSLILILEDNEDFRYPHALPTTYLLDMFGMRCDIDDINTISNPIEYLKKGVVITREADTRIARNLNLMPIVGEDIIFEIYKDEFEYSFSEVNPATLEKVQHVDGCIRDFAQKLTNNFTDQCLYIKNMYSNSYLYSILLKTINYADEEFKIERLEIFCMFIIHFALQGEYDPNGIGDNAFYNYGRYYDSSQPLYAYIPNSDQFNRSLMYLYKECAELLYLADEDDNEDYKIIDIIANYKLTTDQDRAACLIHLYIWFRKRFGITLSKEIVLQILLHDNSVIANKYMNSLIYTAYVLNLNERYKTRYQSNDIAESVNTFLSVVLNKF